MRHKGFNTDDEIDEVLDPLLFAVTSLAGDAALLGFLRWVGASLATPRSAGIGRALGLTGAGTLSSTATKTGHATVLNGGS